MHEFNTNVYIYTFMSRKNLQKKKESKAFSEVHNSLVLKDHFFFFLVALGLTAAWGFSLVAVIRGCSRGGARASHCGDFSRSRTWARGLAGSVVGTRGLSCSVVHEIFLD